MWLFSKNNFLSIVEDKDDPNRLLVRGRLRGDIEAMFPLAEVIEGVGSDYLFRAFVDRTAVVKAVADTVTNIDYTNFKSANNKSRQAHLMGSWQVMRDVQGDRYPDEDIFY